LSFSAISDSRGIAGQVEVLRGVAALHVDEQRVVAAQDRIDVQQVVRGAIGGVAGELAEGAFLGVSPRVDGALQHEVGPRRNADAVHGCPDQLEGLPEQAAGDGPFVHVVADPRRGGEHEQGVPADHHGHRHRLAPVGIALQHPP
jgi:hypothetical protein